ncbi:MFS transporter [Streptomyces sp. NPDC006879]|uniref:MFS transporter n=1 Tax=Streptomyces sp. NPDC006879 TaxID=3364767 RepID=UPI0036A56095
MSSQKELTSSGGWVKGLREVPRAIWLLAAGGFVNAVVSFTFVFVFVYLTGPRSLSAADAGVLTAIGGLGLIAGNFTGGWFGDRYGHRNVLLVASALTATALMALPLLATGLLYAALPLAQYGAGVIRAANSALIASIVPEGSRRTAYAVMRCAANGGLTLGPPLGALLATAFSYDVLFLADGLGTLAVALWAARAVPAGAPVAGVAPTAAANGLLRELRTRPAVLVLLAAVGVTDLVYRQQYSTFPVYLAEHGMDTRFYGLILAVNGGIILLLELPAAVALRRRSPLHLVGSGLLLVGAGFAVLPAGAGLASVITMMALLSIGEILYKTPATAYVADQAPEHLRGRFQSLYAGVSVSGVVLAPALGGLLYQWAPGLLWPLCAALGAMAGLAVLSAAGRTGRWPRAVPQQQPAPGTREAVETAGPAPETGSPTRAVAG